MGFYIALFIIAFEPRGGVNMNQMIGTECIDILKDISAKNLLEKIGKGNHIPGSGSAAALQCMVSAQLAKTVIYLTLDEKRIDQYLDIKIELEDMLKSIKHSVLPNLENLFYSDSEQFDKVIKSRVGRDSSTSISEKSKLAETAKKELKESINIPIKIAVNSIEVAEISGVLFKKGFHSVRGDSGVALSGSIAALEGALAIIDLNFLSIESGEWKEQKMGETQVLRGKCKELKELRDMLLSELEKETQRKHEFDSKIDKVVQNIKARGNTSDFQLEKQVLVIQRLLWEYRDIYFPRTEVEALSFLSPTKLLKQLGFMISLEDSLGTAGEGSDRFEVAGIISNSNKTVQISKFFKNDVRNFTAAHELGHAILHKQDLMHRDRQTDGTKYNRPREEREADKFASYFLMPSKYIEKSFKQRFKTDQLVLNEDVLHFLGIQILESQKKFKTVRSFSQYIAELGFYGGVSFRSMNQHFNVSREAMAIRLEELNLVSL